MPYIEIDNNRIVTGYSEINNQFKESGIKVDCKSIKPNNKLKTDYQNYTGLDQYELNETAQKQTHNAPILLQIAEIEAKNARSLRDAVLRSDLTYIQEQDTQIAELRAQLL